MLESQAKSAKTPDVIQDPEPSPTKDKVSEAPVLVSEQQVMFSTAAAVPSRPTTIARRLIDAIRVVGAAVHRPPARRHHPQRFIYLEAALMAREMDRL